MAFLFLGGLRMSDYVYRRHLAQRNRVQTIEIISPIRSAIDKLYYPNARIAYAFYATTDQHVCNTLILTSLLKEYEMDTSIELVVFVTQNIAEPRKAQLQDEHIRVISLGAVHQSPLSAWADSLAKLEIFNATEYARLIYMDNDMIPRRSLDHFFLLDKYFLYAPRAYWLKQPFFQSTFLVLEPTASTFEAIRARALQTEGADMDVLNQVFGDEVSLLPGFTVVLNGDFLRAASDKSKFWEVNVELLANKASLIHFSEAPLGGYGKPYGKTHEIASHPLAHSLWKETFRIFWEKEAHFCSDLV